MVGKNRACGKKGSTLPTDWNTSTTQPRTDTHTLPQSHARRPLRGIYGGMVHPAYAWQTRHDHRGSFTAPSSGAGPRSGPSTSCLTSLSVKPDSSFCFGFLPHPCASLRLCQPGLTAFQPLALASRLGQSSRTAFPAFASCLTSTSTKPDDPSGFEPDRSDGFSGVPWACQAETGQSLTSASNQA